MIRGAMAVLLLSLPMAAGAENVSEVIRQGNGSYLLKIDGQQYVAISQRDNEQLLGEVATLQQRLAETNAQLESYQKLNNQYDELKGKYAALAGNYQGLSEDALRLNGEFSVAAGKLVTLNHDYSKLVRDYDALAGKYRDIAVRSHPRAPFDAGVGVVRSNEQSHGIVMVGAGTRIVNVDLRGWLFAGEENYGLILGTSF